MINSTIVFDHRGRTAEGSLGTLEIRLTINRRLYYISTGVRVRKSEFFRGDVINRSDSKELNERLENKNSLFMYLTECQRYAVEEFVGQLPPYTGFNNFIYRMSQMGLTAVENSHAK